MKDNNLNHKNLSNNNGTRFGVITAPNRIMQQNEKDAVEGLVAMMSQAPSRQLPPPKKIAVLSAAAQGALKSVRVISPKTVKIISQSKQKFINVGRNRQCEVAKNVIGSCTPAASHQGNALLLPTSNSKNDGKQNIVRKEEVVVAILNAVASRNDKKKTISFSCKTATKDKLKVEGEKICHEVVQANNIKNNENKICRVVSVDKVIKATTKNQIICVDSIVQSSSDAGQHQLSQNENASGKAISRRKNEREKLPTKPAVDNFSFAEDDMVWMSTHKSSSPFHPKQKSQSKEILRLISCSKDCIKSSSENPNLSFATAKRSRHSLEMEKLRNDICIEEEASQKMKRKKQLLVRCLPDHARSEKFVDAIKKSFNCTICCEMYTKPYRLKCGHVFCYKCFRRWIDDRPMQEKQERGRAACPQCRQLLQRRDGSEVAEIERILWSVRNFDNSKLMYRKGLSAEQFKKLVIESKKQTDKNKE